MALTDSDYNAFASSLVSRFADRLRGLDGGAQRLVGTRPQDHVLAGFLTPVDPGDTSEAAEDDLDDALASDLPRDSTYDVSPVATPRSMIRPLMLGRYSDAIVAASWKTTIRTSSLRYGRR